MLFVKADAKIAPNFEQSTIIPFSSDGESPFLT